MNKRKQKLKARNHQYTGYAQFPLDHTKYSQNALINTATLTGAWKSRTREILNNRGKRKYSIELYIVTSEGTYREFQELDKPLSKKEFDDYLYQVFKYILQEYTDVDATQSYFRVRC